MSGVTFDPFKDVSTEGTQRVNSKVNLHIAIALLAIAALCIGLSAWGLTETYMHGNLVTIVLVSTLGILGV